MRKLRMVWMIIAQWIMLVGMLEAGPATLYQEALIAEKMSGDVKRALQLYEQIAVQATGDEAWLANRARFQIDLLRERLGLPKWVAPKDARTTGVSFRQLFQRDFLERSRSSYFQDFDQQLVDLRSRFKIERFRLDQPEDVQARSWFVVWFDRLRQGLGIQSFAEKIAEAAEHRRRLRPMTVVALYQAGLDAEKRLGDFEGAVGYYDRALNQTSDEALHAQIVNRLDFCRSRVKD